MSDFQERLMAADPFAGQEYAHHDGDAMLSRIIAQHPSARRSPLRDFKLRMAGAVTLATLVTFGGIAALDAAVPGLPVLALASSAKSSHAPQASGLATSGMMMRIYEEFNFTPGSALSSSGATGAAYQLVTPSSASGEATRLAAIFSVSGSPIDTNGDGSYWTVTDASGASVNYDTSYGVPQWYFTSNSQGVATPPTSSSAPAQDATSANLPSHSTIESEVATMMQRLGYGYQVSDPQFSTSSTSVVGADASTTTTTVEDVAYSVVVDGMLTDQTVQFSYDSSNTLVSASGPAFSVATTTNYPLQSPVDGVAVLNTQQQSYFKDSNGGSPVPQGTDGTVVPPSSGASPPTTGSGSSTGSQAPPATGDTTSTVVTSPAGPPIVNVTLDSVTTTLQSYTLKDGSLWMLPVYNYSGVVTSSDGSSSTGTWTTIAVDPAYVQVSPATGPIFY